MTTESTTASQHDEHAHGGTGLYVAVFLALIVLTSFSFLTYFDFWRDRVPMEISRAFMIFVSCCKALLVITYFMHLKWESGWKWMLTIPASCMAIFLMLALVPDVGMRMRHASHTRMIHAAEVPPAIDAAHDAPEHDDHTDKKKPAH